MKESSQKFTEENLSSYVSFNETTNGVTVLHLERTLPPSCTLTMYIRFCVYAYAILQPKNEFRPTH